MNKVEKEELAELRKRLGVTRLTICTNRTCNMCWNDRCGAEESKPCSAMTCVGWAYQTRAEGE